MTGCTGSSCGPLKMLDLISASSKNRIDGGRTFIPVLHETRVFLQMLRLFP